MVVAQNINDSVKAMDISTLYQLAVQNDAEFQSLKAQYKADIIEPKVSRAKLLPQISLEANRSRVDDQKIRGRAFGQNSNSATYSYSVDNYSLNLNQPLFRAQYYIELSQSKSIAQKAQLQLELARQDLIIRLATAYLDILTLQKNLLFTKAERDAVQKQYEQSKQRLQVGSDTLANTRKAEATYDLVNATLIDSENSLQIKKLSLRLIVGQDIGTLASFNADIVPQRPTPTDINAWVDIAHNENLELLAEKLTTNIAADEVKRQKSDHLPKVDLYANHGETDIRGGPAARTIRGNEFGISMSLPIFSGGETYYLTKQAIYRYESAMQSLEQAYREVDQKMRSTYLDLMNDINRMSALQKTIVSAQLSYESNEQGFKVGRLDAVDVLLAIEELYQAQRDYAEAQHNYILNTLRLKHVAGRLSRQDVMRISQWLN